MDQIDYQIVKQLRKNGKLSNTELGNKLHISSQAIGKRRTKLEKEGIISDYSVQCSLYKTAFIEIYMNNSNFKQFETAVKATGFDLELNKVFGNYCYLIKYEELTDYFDLNLSLLIEVIEVYARYKVNFCTRVI